MTKKLFKYVVSEIWRLRQQRDYCAAFVKAGRGGPIARRDLREVQADLKFYTDFLASERTVL